MLSRTASPLPLFRGSGLRGLRDRVDALDGRFDVDSPLGAGTTVTVEMPLDRR